MLLNQEYIVIRKDLYKLNSFYSKLFNIKNNIF